MLIIYHCFVSYIYIYILRSLISLRSCCAGTSSSESMRIRIPAFPREVCAREPNPLS